MGSLKCFANNKRSACGRKGLRFSICKTEVLFAVLQIEKLRLVRKKTGTPFAVLQIRKLRLVQKVGGASGKRKSPSGAEKTFNVQASRTLNVRTFSKSLTIRGFWPILGIVF